MSVKAKKVRIVCISDTHNAAPNGGYTLPKGDILIHAGDLSNQGSFAELEKAIGWIERADYSAKIISAGNHDLSLERKCQLTHAEGWKVEVEDYEKCQQLLANALSITYLNHTMTLVSIPDKNVSLRIFGSPYSPESGKKENWAFQYTASAANEIWEAIPTNLDILITHTPPAGHRDTSAHWQAGGCASLLQHLARARPLLHVCGHCHEGRGAEVVRWSDGVRGEGEMRIEAAKNAVEEGVARRWEDPGAARKGNKKQSLLDLTGTRGGVALEAGKETAIVNASIMAKSFGRGAKEFHKPVVVDVMVPVCQAREGS